ncbi:MAG: acetate--CoA ligase family protein [Nitrososphaeria archaeon]|nr:acetate--CoA ligase family protein [Conexivisphaerales archaeon]
MSSELYPLYYPDSISVIGVSPREDNFATIIFKNLLNAKAEGLLKADVYPVNPLYEECLDYKCLKEVPGTDLMIISVPSNLVWQYLKEGDRKGTKTAIVISGGFTEAGGEKLLRENLKIRVLGPNTIGIVNTFNGLNTLFLPEKKPAKDGRLLASLPGLKRGKVAIITQSGGVSVSILDELLSNGIGISSLTCLGNSEDITISDTLEFLSYDENTEAVAMYIEGIRDGRKFMRVASELTKKKKAFALLAGVTQVGKRATMSHTASIMSDYQTYSSALKQSGIVQVQNLRELIDVIKTYELNGTPRSERAVVLTNSGGAGVLAADNLAKLGVEVPPLTDLLIKLKETGKVPKIASLANPVDVSASGNDESMLEVYRSLSEKGFSNFIVISTHYPPGITDKLPEALKRVSDSFRNFNIAVELGNTEYSEHLRKTFWEIGIPAFNSPEEASFAMAYLIRASKAQPTWHYSVRKEPVLGFKGLIINPESSDFLKEFGFRIPTWGWIDQSDLKALPYPVVLKVYREDLIHKTEQGAVRAGVSNAQEALAAVEELKRKFPDGRIYYQQMVKGYEIRLGFVRDDSFGAVASIGLGGILTELYRITSNYVCPVSVEEAIAMLRETKIYDLLSGYRGKKVFNPENLAESVSELSEWVYDKQNIKELEVNPLIVNENGPYAVDIRMSFE